MLVKISPHLRKLASRSSAVKKEFYPSPLENRCSARAVLDPLLEEKYKKVKGLIHKYPRRVLIELSLDCPSYCRFCTRRRKVSDIEKGRLEIKDIARMIHYLKSRPEINEVVFSGGDPLMVPDLLIYALRKISVLKQIKILRVHTRAPVSQPELVNKKILRAFSRIKHQPLFVSIHFEHPDEITPKVVRAIHSLRKTGAILLCQSVFLKGINDSYIILKNLFTRLIELGIRPYYIYRCDLVKGAEHFIVPFKKEIAIMTKLRKNLSGIACPLYVIDTPGGAGKVPIPLNFWKFEHKHFLDFRGKKIKAY